MLIASRFLMHAIGFKLSITAPCILLHNALIHALTTFHKFRSSITLLNLVSQKVYK